MIAADLPSPGIDAKAYNLRRASANAISAMDIAAQGYPLQKHPGAAQLKAFFMACAAACAPFEG